MNAIDLTQQENHYKFGDNWKAYSKLIDEKVIQRAESALLKLLSREEISGSKFLDIGCGSGLHALAALRLGASSVFAVDIDPQSVETTREILGKFAPNCQFNVKTVSVFDLNTEELGSFDIVYSWGVLHHTGDLNRALSNAAVLVAPGGLLAVALYRKIRMDSFWKWEKKWFVNASPKKQKIAENLYILISRLKLWSKGINYRKYERGYRKRRGMDIRHDAKDWLGGYPYQSISPKEIETKLNGLGYQPHRLFARERISLGLLGSGCNEYVYKREVVE